MKNTLLALLAVVAIGFGGYGLFFPKSQHVVTLPNVTQEKEASVRLWVTKHAVPRGELIRKEDIKLKKIRLEDAYEQGIDADVELLLVDGMLAKHDISAFQWVQSDDFITPEQDGYVDLIIQPNRVPYPIEVDPEVVVGGVITHGTKVDILALASINQNLANENSVASAYGLNLTPLLMSVPVLQVKQVLFGEEEQQQTRVNLILELTQRDVAKITIAKRVAQLEVHKSLVDGKPRFLSADSGDVLPEFKAVKQYRPNQRLQE